MDLTIADEQGRASSVQLGPNDPIESLQAIIEAELGIPAAQQVLMKDGNPLRVQAGKSLTACGCAPGDLIFVVKGKPAPQPGATPRSLDELPPNVDPQQLLQFCTANPMLLKEMQHVNPPLADAVKSGELVKIRTVLMKQAMQVHKVKFDKDKKIAKLMANPDDVDAQKEIEEMVRMENVQRNMEIAMEEMPEAFGRVVMLYIDAEVNGVPIKAFVDSGAQSTIMSVDLAQRCGLMRLVDSRYSGVAQGVGTAKILGRVHIAELKIGRSFFPCTFTVLEKNDVEFLFGLDMLKRHQCVLDLRRGVLQLGSAGEEVPFLSEKDIPMRARNTFEGDPMDEELDGKMPASISTATSTSGGASSSGGQASSQSSSSSSGGASSSGGGGSVSAGVQELMNLGFTKVQAENALARANGDVSLAASLLYAEMSDT